MANPIPEILVDVINGPTLTFVHSDGSSSSLSINASNQLIAMSGSTPIPYAAANTASYVSYQNIANVPSGIISSSAQLPAGTVSSSAQVLTGANVWSSSAQLPSGTVSSSAQVLVGSGAVSSSVQVTTLLPANVVSSSAQVVANLAGQQVSVSGVTGSLFGTATTASFVATASWSRNASSASYIDFIGIANKPALVSSSAQILVGSTVWSSSAQLPAGVVSSSGQVVSNLIGQQVSLTGVTGSLLGTASFSSQASTASYINLRNVPSVGYAYGTKTTTQTVTSANTFQQVPFDGASSIDSAAWTFGSGASTLTCIIAGYYTVDSTAYLQKTRGVATVGGVRLTKNGNELSGSFNSFTFASNNVIQPFTVQAMDYFAVNDVLNLQVIGGGTNIQIAQVPAVGGPIMRPSAIIRVTES